METGSKNPKTTTNQNKPTKNNNKTHKRDECETCFGDSFYADIL